MYVSDVQLVYLLYTVLFVFYFKSVIYNHVDAELSVTTLSVSWFTLWTIFSKLAIYTVILPWFCWTCMVFQLTLIFICFCHTWFTLWNLSLVWGSLRLASIIIIIIYTVHVLYSVTDNSTNHKHTLREGCIVPRWINNKHNPTITESNRLYNASLVLLRWRSSGCGRPTIWSLIINYVILMYFNAHRT